MPKLKTSPIFLMHPADGRGSVLLWWGFNMLCTAYQWQEGGAVASAVAPSAAGEGCKNTITKIFYHLTNRKVSMTKFDE